MNYLLMNVFVTNDIETNDIEANDFVMGRGRISDYLFLDW